MNKPRFFALIAAVLLQFLVLIGVYLNAAVPLWWGEEIRVETLPVDPRSLFRGNYARLGYGFSRLPRNTIAEETLRNGEKIYVVLSADKDGIYRFKSASLTQPKTGTYLKGRVRNAARASSGSTSGSARPLHIEYGIEAYFAPKEEAIALENTLRDGAIAVLRVTRRGKARLVAIEPL